MTLYRLLAVISKHKIIGISLTLVSFIIAILLAFIDHVEYETVLITVLLTGLTIDSYTMELDEIQHHEKSMLKI